MMPAKRASQRITAPAATPTSARQERRPAADDGGQDELLAARVLLSAQRAYRSEHAPEAREDDQRAEAPRCVAADREQIVGYAVEKAYGLVVFDGAGELEASATRRCAATASDQGIQPEELRATAGRAVQAEQ